MIYFQHEKSRKVHHPSSESVEKRKLLRKSYDSTGPNDERYYVSASSGIGQKIIFVFKYIVEIFFQELTVARERLTHLVEKKTEIFL